MRFPTTLAAFIEDFPDEAACWRFLFRARWPRGFVCPRCQHRAGYFLAARRLRQCAACRHQVSVTAGTVFHKTRLPLRTWFLAIFFVGRHKQGISALQLRADTGIGSYRAAWLLLHKLRATLGREPGERLLGHVEADESYLGAPHEKGRRGGRAFGRKTLVGVVVERRRDAGRVRLDVLDSHGFDQIGPFVRGAVDLPRTTLHSDGLSAYVRLARAGLHEHVRTVQGTDRAQGPRLFPWSHVIFSNLKSWLRGTFHGVSPAYLPQYLEEFSFRYNHRSRPGELATLVLRRALRSEPMPLLRLRAELTA